MREIQFREAICEAMSEEMRKDESIYLMGEEVAEYNGAYKASKGMLDEFGEKRVIDTPISELPMYKNIEHRKDTTMKAQTICDTILTLPIDPFLTDEEIENTCNIIMATV